VLLDLLTVVPQLAEQRGAVERGAVR